ncbi:hypothetical protein [Cellulosimicrobium protaetiae]|uniref:Uncharacterized protein n=1 Tax=Cellulosimicrobium protaetiae TaxID=2587808 RepID=A0A6M5UH21_9MICO|nr:hypothetical protein [Cellulosimicrobium protaetiae]QJW36463.1 hypothetical protein FIC82_009920 [Cellulosimicrobium protaetiae]
MHEQPVPAPPPPAEGIAEPEGSPVPTPARRPGWVLPVVTGVVGVAIGVVGTLGVTSAQQAADEQAQADAAAAAEEAQQSVLKDAMATCGVNDGEPGIRVGDAGRTLTVDHKGDDDFEGASSEDLFCIVGALDTPSSVTSHMEQTTSMDGRQTESWDNVTVSWSYHPDRGMDSVFTVE